MGAWEETRDRERELKISNTRNIQYRAWFYLLLLCIANTNNCVYTAFRWGFALRYPSTEVKMKMRRRRINHKTEPGLRSNSYLVRNKMKKKRKGKKEKKSSL